MFENLNPITTIAWNSTSFTYSKLEKMGKIVGKVPKLQEKMFDFPLFHWEVRPVFLKSIWT